ncbi:UvrD-helicase domain-containing protein [Flavobacterium aurantiibacter]|uniref:DNA 3'-5' helicase n=1 Tax=Flavobacterium aurantiibacter TaxID=2023067 RepID=A0A255ZQX4_9FLAO|nr:UvrD-helicase domain-containing protein [Flavobacterium aurantiibacter]OYQ43903.1 hypothetical protein CHX27_08485 [Flavobacterium aurantiibacter]
MPTISETPSISIYYASAGSGKTYTLVKEYLKILLCSPRVDAYKRILAVTFTNKAVSEMKSRILESLYAFSLDEPSDKMREYRALISSEIGKSEQEIQQHANAIVKNLLHNYASFDIMTLDKFTHRVIRAFAVDFDLPVNFDVTLDTKTILQEAVERVINDAGNDPILTEILLEHLENNVEEGNSHRMFQQQLYRDAEVITKDDFKSGLEELRDFSMFDFRSFQKQLRQKISEAKAELAKRAAEVKADFDRLWEQGPFIAANSKFISQIQTQDDKYFDKKFESIESLRVKKGFDTPALLSDLEKLLAKMQLIYELRTRKSRFQLIVDKIVGMSLLLQIRKEFREVQRERDEIPLSEFNEIIANNLQQQPALFIYERIGGKYDHFFIDEFQDTSVLQWNNLVPLIDNTTAGMSEDGTKGTLMIVGDPKQAIYRWRGGRAELLQGLANQTNKPFVNDDVQTFVLDTNYRSFSNVIAFNNAFFDYSKEFLASESTKALYSETASQKPNSKQGGSVRVTVSEIAEHENVVIDSIRHFLSLGFKYQDIAVLSNKNAELYKISEVLLENNIPILSAESLQIKASPDVKLIKALLQLLYNPEDTNGQFEFLYQLAQLQTALTVDAYIASNLAHWREMKKVDFPESVAFPANFDTLRLMSIFEVIHLCTVWLEAQKQHAFSDAYLQVFGDLALQCEARGLTGLQDFLEFLEEKKGLEVAVAPPPGVDAVKLMSVHKSKGLEFPVVIYPFVATPRNAPPEKLWIPNEAEDIELPLTLIDSNAKLDVLNDTAGAVFTEVQQQRQTDKMNQYYVAFTRAEEHLHIVTVPPPKSSSNPFNIETILTNFATDSGMQALESQSFIFGDDTTSKTATTDSISVDYLSRTPQKEQRNAIKIADRAALLWGSAAEKALATGILLHELLAEVKQQEDVQNVIEKAVQSGKLTTDELAPISVQMQKIVAHPDLSEFFSRDVKTITEQAILSAHAPILKPDRVSFLNKNQVALLDYKTGSKRGEHAKQLDSYAAVLQEMGLEVVKKALVYTSEELEVVLVP